MYSRNLTENSMSGIRLNPNARFDKSKGQSEAIPVKSFTDNFAYDRFNRMGNVKENTETPMPPPINFKDSEEKDNQTETEAVSQDTSLPDITEEKDSLIEAKNEGIGLSERFKAFFDADTILIILAAVMLLFSDNAINDKLTPLALLAILFF